MEPNIIGRTIDSYQIMDILGRGGMGVVYRARDLMLDKDVAVKMMDARLDPEGRLLKRFQEEARSLARLQHANIVGIYTLRESQLGLCIVMEFVKGRNLSDILKETGGLPLGRFKKIFLQCLNALEHAHTEGIIHRDIKPSNIMLTDLDVVKITDFGLAKRLDPTPNASTILAGGTLYYSPPEQLDSLADVDYRGDIYSLGMTMYEALTGKIPFADTASDFRIRKAIVEGEIPPPSESRPDLPDDLVRLVMKAIHKDPSKRFRSAADMGQALESCSISVIPSPRRRRVESPPRVFPVKAFAIGIFIIAFAVLAYLLIPQFISNSPELTTGNVAVHVQDESGEPVPNAIILIDRAKDAAQTPVELADANSKAFHPGQFSTTSDYTGVSRFAYRASPEARFEIIVEADSFGQATRTFALPRDSVVVVMTRLEPSRPREMEMPARSLPPTVALHDKNGNPVPSAVVTMVGKSGKEYAARTDMRGKAIIEDYSISAEGEAPRVRIAVNQSKVRLRGQPKAVRIQTGSETTLDINDFVPYDQTLADMRGAVETVFDGLQGAKGRIGGTEDQKLSDADYRQAVDLEKRGQRQFDANDFENAKGSFLRAKSLYARAAERLKAQSVQGRSVSPSVVAEKDTPADTEPLKPEPSKKTIAPVDMRGIMERCKSSFEKEDVRGLSQLLHFNSKEQSTWSTFFDIAENVQVTTESGNVEDANGSAQIAFGLTISYENRFDGETHQLRGDMNIGLQYNDGKWEVVSHQFKNR